jgi:rhodanese-related sulfurtransferase
MNLRVRQPAEYLRRAGQIELRDARKKQKADVERVVHGGTLGWTCMKLRR